MTIKVYASLLGILLVTYAVVELALGLSTVATKANEKFCAAWLCPEEFSAARVGELVDSAGQSSGSIGKLKRALVFDSASAYAWADLGDALANAGNFPQARYCFDRSVTAGPRSPAILMRAANFAFREGNIDATFRDLSAILRDRELTSYYEPVFLTYTRLGVPVQDVLNRGIPAQIGPAQAFLRFLMEGNQIADAETTWNWMAQHVLYDESLTNDYLNFLVRSNEPLLAGRTWAGLNAATEPDYERTNFVFNGGFEHAPKVSPFDWHIEQSDDVQVTRVSGQCQSGQWCLKLRFQGEQNVDFHQVFEEAPLPAGRWKLRAMMRTEGITTDQGVRLRAFDQHVDATTDALKDTNGWTPVEQDFELKQPAVVRVELVRQASKRFDNKIAGTAWIDSVTLNPVR